MSIFSSLPGFRDRFWYWQGASGKRYIHSIYSPQDCPPLPGAIYLTVRKVSENKRRVVEIGRFEENWDRAETLNNGFSSVDEIHVHLLAKSDDNADEVVRDLEAGVWPRLVRGGFHEEKTQPLSCQPSLFDGSSEVSLLASA